MKGLELVGDRSRLLSTDPARLDQYRLIKRLGAGGQGVVYLADTPASKLVALKLLKARFAEDGQARERFLREVMAARKVGPAWTARVLDVSVTDDQPYVVSEYIPGRSLDQEVRKAGRLPYDNLMRVAAGTAAALVAIHRAGVVHSDFKPGNVMLGPDGPRVVDFGISHALTGSVIAPGRAFGTPCFMPPEQFAGKEVGPAADLFSWGVTMAFASSRRLAFGYDNPRAVMQRVVHEEPDLRDVPDGLLPVIRACLAKKAAARPDAEWVLGWLSERVPDYPQLMAEINRAMTSDPGFPPPGTVPPDIDILQLRELTPRKVPIWASARTHDPVPPAETSPPPPPPAPPAPRWRPSRGVVISLILLFLLAVAGGFFLGAFLIT